MFYVLTQLHKEFVALRLVSWNYLEAGHGKGAPDGLGAVLKRKSDRIVKQGEDIGTFQKFVKVFQTNEPHITIEIVSNDEIVPN
ncbi:unnamed protein product [Parnassius apollo]|uniref:(apollo) hypothetical protein n=1 Tax=Parnassius apollo TaxID=110799 RepID=A0A8S3W854_PARAO|nr:unnamed protein product [Parnassius apollo]